MRTQVLAALALSFSFATPAIASEARSGPYSLELVGENGSPLPTYEHGGRTYVLGAQGQRYSLRIQNNSDRRVEFVSSVDGRDVLDGQPADVAKNGYVVFPHDQVVIDGFRLDHESVAAFRFSQVSKSYASLMGDARDVGVIGVAVFQELPPPPPPMPVAKSPSCDGFAEPSGGGRPSHSSAPKGLAAPAATAAAEMQLDDRAKKDERVGLGTEFGEQRNSHVNEVQFARASSNPSAVLSLRYNDRPGLLAVGIDLDCYRGACERGLRETAQPFRRSFSQPPAGWSSR